MKPLDPLGCATLQPNDKKLVEALLAVHQDDSYVHYCGRIEKKKYKVEKRVLIVSSHKIYCMKPSGKLARESHLLDVLEIKSLEPTELELIFRTFRIFIPSSEEVFTIINAIRRAFETNFAEAPVELRPKLFIKQTSKLSETQSGEVVSRDNRPCRGFISTYRSLCVYRGVATRLDVCWDLAHIHARKGRTKLNLTQFQQQLSTDDIKVLLEALRFNSFFTILSLKDLKFEKERDALMASVAETFRYNTSITKLSLRGVGATREGIAQLAESLAVNKNVSLISIDLSNNQLEDKGMISFAGYLQHTTNNVTHLNFSGCMLGSKAIVALAVGFSTNPQIAASLRFLSLSNNKLGPEACKSLADWLLMPIQLSDLVLSNTTSSDNLEILISAITKGCSQLATLDVSHNMMEKEAAKALVTLLKSGSPHMRLLDLTNTQLPIDSLKEMMKLMHGELIIKENNLSSFPGAQMINSVAGKIAYITKLDLSDNDLGDEGIQLVGQGLCNSTSINHLILNGNIKPSKTRATRVAAIDALIALIRSPCPLKKLELAAVGNPAAPGARSKTQMQLKQDLLPLLAVLALNTTLTSLDISGHMMGNKGATALGKALQINNSLLHLAWDENGTTLQGFTYFRIGVEGNRGLVHMPLPLFDVTQAMKGSWETGGAANDKNLLQTIRDIEQSIYRNAASRFHIPLSSLAPPPPLRLPNIDATNNNDKKHSDLYDDESDLSISSPRSREEEEEECQDHWAWTTDQATSPASPVLSESIPSFAPI